MDLVSGLMDNVKIIFVFSAVKWSCLLNDVNAREIRLKIFSFKNIWPIRLES